MRSDYTLFRRKGSRVYYFYTLEDGRRVARSTGKTDKYEAIKEARKARERRAEPVTVAEFVKDFFVWGKCNWMAARHSAGESFSAGAAAGRRSHITAWIEPKWGKRTIASITAKELRDWLYGLPLSGQSKNHLRYTLKIIFGEAVLAGQVERNPVLDFGNVALNRKTRDPFTLADLALFFPQETAKLLEVWKDALHATLFMLLAACGLRSGEARALAWRHVLGPLNGAYFLLIEQAVKPATGRRIGTTKAGKPRPVYLPERARGCLEWWRPQCPWNESDDLIFPSENRGVAMGDQGLRDRLHGAMKRAGIKVEGRTLVTHSFRHGYVSRSKRVIPAELLLMMAGHANEKIQAGYVHPQLEDQLREIGAAAKTIEGTWPTN